MLPRSQDDPSEPTPTMAGHRAQASASAPAARHTVTCGGMGSGGLCREEDPSWGIEILWEDPPSHPPFVLSPHSMVSHPRPSTVSHFFFVLSFNFLSGEELILHIDFSFWVLLRGPLTDFLFWQPGQMRLQCRVHGHREDPTAFEAERRLLLVVVERWSAQVSHDITPAAANPTNATYDIRSLAPSDAQHHPRDVSLYMHRGHLHELYARPQKEGNAICGPICGP